MNKERAEILTRYFAALREHDWEGLAQCLATDVRRTGPYLDVVEGREAYAKFLAGVVPALQNYALDVASMHDLESGEALVRLSETLDVDGVATTYPEALVFGFDADGRIARVEIFIQRPN